MVKIEIQTPRTTRFTVLKVSPAVFNEIELRLRLSQDEHPFHLMDTGQGKMIDLAGFVISPDDSLLTTSTPINDLKTLLDQKVRDAVAKEDPSQSIP